jgi:hypothetical protein
MEIVDYYLRQGVMTEPVRLSHWLEDLPQDISVLAQVIQGLLIHPLETELYQVTVSAQQRKELQIRSAAAMLEQIYSLDSASLAETRPSCTASGGKLPQPCGAFLHIFTT